MNTSKRKIPVAVIEAIESILKEYTGIIDLIFEQPEKNILVIKEYLEESKFFFRIIGAKKNASGTFYEVVLNPASSDSLLTQSLNVNLEDLKKNFKYWCNRILVYQEESIFDDLILGNYKKEYSTVFESINLVDDNANTEPFNYPQQIFLLEQLKTVNEVIEKAKKDNLIDNEEYENINNDIKAAEKNLGKETKQRFLNRVSTIFAKARKANFKVGQMLFEGFIKAIGTEAGKKAFHTVLEKLPQMVSDVWTIIGNTQDNPM